MARRLTDHNPLMQIDTPLNKVPRGWLEFVEPHIHRGKGQFPSCWLYLTEDGRAPDYGEPRIYVNRKPILLKNFIAEMFWPGIRVRGQNAFEFVYHECGVINCLNPNHFLVCKEHSSWINVRSYVMKKQNSLRRWKKELAKKNAAAHGDGEGDINDTDS